MSLLVTRVRSAVRYLISPGDRVVVALSGGPDSVALSLLLLETLPTVGSEMVGVAHLNHGMRGAESDEDEAFCRAFAASHGLPCLVERAHVAGHAAARGLSVEAAGHELRHAFFERTRHELCAQAVATGHTLNDLAETFLMRALRGAGLRGLGAIRPVHGTIVRPLLDVSRTEILAYLDERSQPFREDATNRDTSIIRNRVRHELLPWLEQRITPRAIESLARTARVAAGDHQFLQSAATAAGLSVVIECAAGIVSLDAARLGAQPVALGRRIVLEAMERLAAGTVSVTSVDRVLALITGTGSRRGLDCRGVRAVVDNGRLILTKAVRRRKSAGATGLATVFSGQLTIPGDLALPRGRLTAKRVSGGDPGRLPSVDRDTVMLDECRIREPLIVRFRKPGDRIRPLGMAGRKKLQDVLVDRKVPRNERDGIPLVVDADEQIVWVVGHMAAENVRVTSATTSVLILQYWR